MSFFVTDWSELSFSIAMSFFFEFEIMDLAMESSEFSMIKTVSSFFSFSFSDSFATVSKLAAVSAEQPAKAA